MCKYTGEKMMKKVLVFMAIFLMFQANLAFATEARYHFVFSQFTKICSDVPKEETAARLLRSNHQILIGHSKDYKFVLNESLLEMVENLYSISQVLLLEARMGNRPLDCLMTWGRYVKFRADGKTPDEAKKATIIEEKIISSILHPTK